MMSHSELLTGELTQAFAAILAQEELLAATRKPALVNTERSQVPTCAPAARDCLVKVTTTPTCKADPKMCPVPSKVVTCKPDPKICPTPSKVPTCVPDPRICPVASKVPTCKPDPRICPVVSKVPTCKADPKICPPLTDESKVPTCKPDPKICPAVTKAPKACAAKKASPMGAMLQDWVLPSSQPHV